MDRDDQAVGYFLIVDPYDTASAVASCATVDNTAKALEGLGADRFFSPSSARSRS
jgi:hypothetical protein